MRTLLLSVLCGITAWAAADGKASDKKTTTLNRAGIRFRFPKAWKHQVDDRTEFVGMIVRSDTGTGVTLQVFKTAVTAPAVQKYMKSRLEKRFRDRIVAGSRKKAQRTLLDKKRDGLTMTMRVNATTTSRVEFYALQLPKKKKTLFIIFQNSSDDATAKRVFDEIAGSLKEADK